MNKTIITESTLEYHACFYFEYSSGIKSYESQPLGFEYKLDGTTHFYTPDFATIDHQDIRKFFEVKPKKFTQSDSFKRNYKAIQEAAKSNGYDLELINEYNIYSQPELDNLKLLHRYSELSVNDKEYQLILQFIKKDKHPSINEINKQIECGKNMIGKVCNLISKGILQTDLQVPLSLSSIVWLHDGHIEYPFIKKKHY